MSTQTFDHVQTNTLTVGDVRVTGAALTTLMAGNNSTLSIDLSDEEGARALFIEEPTENTLNVAIQNEAAVDVTFVAKTGTPSNSNYHIKLQFSTGFGVTAATLAFAKSVKGWTAVLTKSRGRGTLYLLNTSGLTLKAFGQANDEIELPLVYTNVTPAGGALQSRVSVSLNKSTAYVKDANNDKVALERADRTQFLELVKTGKPAPLALELVGRRTICNDGTAHTLTLQLKNLLDDGPIKLAPTTGTAPPTQLIISFDKAGTKWSLGTQAEIDGITVSPPSGWSNTSNKWLLKTTNTSLARNGTVQITLGTVKSTLAPGFANVYVRYKDLPGYSDGVLVAQIEKSPLLYSDAAGSGMTLNGTTGSSNALSIGVNASGAGLRVHQQGDGWSGEFQGGGGVNISNVGPSDRGLTLDPIKSSIDAFFVNQTGTGHAAIFQGGKGVQITGVTNGQKGLDIDVTSSDSGLYVKQQGSGNSASFNGGSGVLITGVTDGKKGLDIDVTSSNIGLSVKQQGTAQSARFEGGAGVLITGVTGSKNGLDLEVKTSLQAFYVGQQGTGNSAAFNGGIGVAIYGVTGDHNGLAIDPVTTTQPALWVNQLGTGKSAQFHGGGGVVIDGVKDKNAGLSISIKTSEPALVVNQQKDDGFAAKFTGGKGVYCDTFQMGSTAITETELAVLKKLAGSQLKCEIYSDGTDHRIENHGNRYNSGDGERTIQFANVSNDNTTMKLVLT